MLARTKSGSTPEDSHGSKKKRERPKKSPKVEGKKISKSAKKEAGGGQSGSGGGGARGQSQSCHQCRQSIHSSKGVSEVKSGRERLKCSRCTRYWCEQCLHNRYGVNKSEQNPASWVCPVCSDNCNCSLCRKKAGKLATGILTPLVKSAGFGNVSDFLDKGTDDIAKVLQWKSPEVAAAETVTQTKKKRRLDSATCDGGQTSVKRKRRARAEDVENSTTLANTPSPVSGCLGDRKAQTGSGKRKRSNGQCHRGNGRPKRRRRLSHPSYSITVEEDDPVDHIESSERDKLSLSTTLPSPGAMETVDNGTATAIPPIKGDTKSVEKISNELSTPSQSESDPDGNLMTELSSPFRRSQRKRKNTRRYLSHDFRPVSDDDEMLFASPKSKRRRSYSGKEKRVNFRSPLFSPNSAESADDGDGGDDLTSVEFIMKQKELEELRSSTISVLRENKIMSRQEVAKERERLREEARKKRQEEKEKVLKEKAKLREQEKLNKVASQEKLKLARNILREAQKDARRRQKEREKVRKQEELHLLKERRQTEKRKKQELTSAPILKVSHEVSSLEDDSPTDCEAAGLPNLPDLPSLEFPFSPDMIPLFFFVSEFLHTFADALELKRRLSARELSKLMAGGRGLGDLYLSLLLVLVDEDSQLHKQLKPTKRQRDLEHLARTYLHDVGKNGFIQDHSAGLQSLEESLVILHHLCEEALSSAAVTEHMEACHEQIDQLRKDERQREREKSKDISEQLKQLCEGGGCTLEDIETKRKEFTRELEEMRRSSEQEQLSCRLAIRNTFLGCDRYNRIFWKLQSFPGVIVEVLCSSGGGEVEEGCLFEGEGEDGGSAVASQWLVVHSIEHLEQIMGSLHPRGKREGQLLSSLCLHKSSIATQLERSNNSVRVKKFYGSN